MPYLIDGNNLIGAIPVIDIRDPEAREKMTGLLAKYQRVKNNSIEVVYDGPPPAGTRPVTYIGPLKVSYAGPESDADTLIKKIVKESRSPSSIIVVSSDKQVYSYCKWAGAQVIKVMAFYSDLKKTLESNGQEMQNPSSLSQEELNDWMQYFGVEGKEQEDSESES